jgi:hypothetical protein
VNLETRLHNDKFVGLAPALAAFLVYLSTLAPAVSREDCGEIATSLYTLGIVHPTGYPLFTLLGWAFAHLPLGGRVIWKLNVLVALLCSGAVYSFFRLFVFLLSEEARTVFQGKASAPKAHPASDLVAAAVAVLILAFSRTYWSEAISLEVYAFHLLFLSVVTSLFLRALAELQTPGPTANRWWTAFALTLGLSFSNHMMTVLLAPAFLYLYFTVHGVGGPAWRKIGRAIPPFVLGLSPYLYLPLRAAQKPLMNWGDPSTLGNLWWHVSARIYQFKMSPSYDAAFAEAVHFLSRFPAEFGYAPLLLALLGLWTIFRDNRRMLIFSLLIFLSCLFYTFSYAVDYPDYYLNAYFATAIWMVYGVRSVLRYAAAREGWRPAAGVLCAAFIAFPLALNYRAVDKRRNFLLEDYTRNILESLEPGALLFTSQYTTLTAIAYYLQQVEGVRTDVLVLDTQLLKFPWYYGQLERQQPWIVWGSRAKMAAFFRANEEFERGDSLDSAAFVRHAFPQYVDAIRSILKKAYETHPIYVTVETGLDHTMGFEKIPSGMVFRLYRGSVPPFVPRGFGFRPFPENDPLVPRIKGYYAEAYFNQGAYLALAVGDTASGLQMLREAVALKPDFPKASLLLQRLVGIP